MFTVSVLVDSDAESISSSDYSTKSSSINVLSKHQNNNLQPGCSQKSALTRNRGQLSLCDSSSIESDLDEIVGSISNFDIEFNHNAHKIQLLKRCKQTDVLPFDEIYSAR